jgi:hypothetical protein
MRDSKRGTQKTAPEIKNGPTQRKRRPYDDPEKRDWFATECAEVGLKPETSALFDYLE